MHHHAFSFTHITPSLRGVWKSIMFDSFQNKNRLSLSLYNRIMKKLISWSSLILLLSSSAVGFADQATTNASSTPTTQNSSAQTAETQNKTNQNGTDATNSGEKTSESSNSEQTSSAQKNAGTQTSTTAQENTAPIANDSTKSDQNRNSPASSTTVIKETVNNSSKPNQTNLIPIILSSLSAVVTIVGGILAFLKHLRKKVGTQKSETPATLSITPTSQELKRTQTLDKRRRRRHS